MNQSSTPYCRRTDAYVTSQIPGFLALLCILLGFAIWGLRHLGGFSWSWDEGVMLMTSRAVSLGYGLYEPIWYDYPPLFPLLFGALFRLFGPSEQLARGVILGLALLLATGVAHITWQITRRSLAAAGTALLMVLTPPFLANSRAVLADVPALCLAVWSLSLAMWAMRRPRWGIWVGSGALLGLSLAIKPTSAFVGLPLIYAAMRSEPGPLSQNLLRRTAPLIGLGLGTVVAIGLSLASVSPSAFWHQFAGALTTSQQVHPWEPIANLAKMGRYLALGAHGPMQVGFPVMLTVGCLGAWRCRHTPVYALLLLWLGAGSTMWFLYTLLYNHQIVSLLAPAAILAGLGVDWLASWTNQRIHLRSAIQLVLVLGLAVLVGGGAILQSTDRALAMPPDDDEDADALELAQVLSEYLRPGAYIVTDSPMLAFETSLSVPPELVNLSSRRVKTGQLDAAQAIAWTQAYQVPAIIFWDDRLTELPEYVSWVQERYRLARRYGRERRLYLLADPPAQEIAARFGDTVALQGATLVSVDGEAHLSLHWRALTVPESDYVLRIEEATSEGWQTVYQEALAPSETSPTRWNAGDLVVGSYHLGRLGSENTPAELAITLYADDVALPCRSQGGLAPLRLILSLEASQEP